MKPFITQTSDNALNIDALAHKLFDADSYGFWAECLPSEAEAIGAFTEDGQDPRRVAPSLAVELATMASWLGAGEVTVADRGDLAGPLRAALTSC